MFKKFRSKKGFTLIELMAVIIIVGILSILSIAAITRFIAKSRQQKVIQNKKNIVMAAEMYLQANRDLMPKMIGDHAVVEMMQLRNANYLKEDVTNEKGEDCMKESFVWVFKLSDNDYSYNAHLYCGDEKAPASYTPPVPYLVDQTVTTESGTKTSKVAFSGSNDVKKANFSFILKGAEHEDIGIYSYSYSILAQIGGESSLTEVYNSGTLEANLNPSIEFQSRQISSYLDLSGTTKIEVKVTALNEEGGFLSYETNGLAAFGEASFVDTISPLCPDLHDYAGRLGEPRTYDDYGNVNRLDDWINKSDMDSNRYPRLITLRCDDQEGSGCKRDTFSQSWPDASEEYKFGVIFGEIVMADNAVNDENGVRKDPNSIVCPINVLVDVKSPTIELTPRNPKDNSLAGEGEHFQNEGGNYTGVAKLEDGPEPVPTPPVLELNATEYKDVFLGFEIDAEDSQVISQSDDDDSSAGWLNLEYYPDGVEYDVYIEDNLYLMGYTWEVNAPHQNLEMAEANIDVLYSDQYEGSHWNRDEDDNLRVNEQAIMLTKQELDPSTNHYTFKIHFKDEGARYGVLTVYDRAGNYSRIEIHANLDRTPPPLDYPGNELDSQYYSTLNLYQDMGVSLYNIENRQNIPNGEVNVDSSIDPPVPFKVPQPNYYLDKNMKTGDGEEMTEEMVRAACYGRPQADEVDLNNLSPWGTGYSVCCEEDFLADAAKSCKWYDIPEAPLAISYSGDMQLNGAGTIYGVKKGQSVKNLTVGRDQSTQYKNMEGSYVPQEEPDDYNTPPTPEEGASSDLLQDRRVGCYKIGTVDGTGNNEIPEKDIHSPDLEEYESGTWSNESLLCGPLDNMSVDNYVTNDDGQQIELNNEISGWFAVEVNYYKQYGSESNVSPDYSTSYSNPSAFNITVHPTYNISNPDYYETHFIYSNDRDSWIKVTNQGTHKLVWTTCDKAGNCYDNSIYDDNPSDTITEKGNNTVVVKVDTVKPICVNSVKYDKYVTNSGAVKLGTAYNSDNEVGPNHNGWLYDKQVATVFHSCVDVAELGITSYSEGWEYSNAYGSGCAGGIDSPTNDYFDYAFDVYTSMAGTSGVGADNLGTVEDVAGNVGTCNGGVNVWKDSVSPACNLGELWRGENFNREAGKQHNVPSKHFWAVDGQTYYVYMETCRDDLYAYHSIYNGQKAFSSCYFDYDNAEDVVVRKASNYLGSFGYYDADEYAQLYDQIMNGTYNATGEDDEYFYDTHNTVTVPLPNVRFVAISEPFMGEVGLLGVKYHLRYTQHETNSGEYIYSWENAYMPYSGYMVDQAGNISFDTCYSLDRGLDRKTPTCASQLQVQNRSENLGGKNGQVFDSYGQEWVGSTGGDESHTPEYAKVGKGCNDAVDSNYLYNTIDKHYYDDYSNSGCDLDDQEDQIFWWYGNPAVLPAEAVGRYTAGEYQGQASFNGPGAIISAATHVIDRAGYVGYGRCEPVQLNIDYTAPNCQTHFQYYDSNTHSNANYTGQVTNQDIFAKGKCVSDNGRIQSGCNAGADYDYEAYHIYKNPVYNYTGKNSNQQATTICVDVAGNYSYSSGATPMKQDKVNPKVTCSYTGYYNKDGNANIKVTFDSLYDPTTGSPDHYASGLNYSKSEIIFSNGGNLSKTTLTSGQTVYNAAPTCNSSTRKIKVSAIVYDNAGNYTAVNCSGDPIEVPGCCTRMGNEPDVCGEYHMSDCSVKCGGGTQMEVRSCTNHSYYNGQTCTFKDYDQSTLQSCNTMACCSQTVDDCGTCVNKYEGSNPCSYGFQQCRTVSKFDSRVSCGGYGTFKKVCQVNPTQCDQGMDPQPGSAPSSNSCDLYLAGYNAENDVIDLRPTSSYCRFDELINFGSGDNPADGCFLRRDRTNPQLLLHAQVTPYVNEGQNAYRRMCLFDITWTSRKFDYTNSIYRNYSFGVVQCRRSDGSFEYCMNTCDSGSCIPKA